MVGVHPEVLDTELVSARHCERQSATSGMIYHRPLSLYYIAPASDWEQNTPGSARGLSNKIQQSSVDEK